MGVEVFPRRQRRRIFDAVQEEFAIEVVDVLEKPHLAEFEKIGKKKWNKRLRKIFAILQTVFNYDTLYIGGGNARHVDFELAENMKTVTNEDGIKGGAVLWQKPAPR